MPAVKVLEAIANAGAFHVYSEEPEDCCHATVGDVEVLTAIPGRPSLDRKAVEALRERKHRPAVKHVYRAR